MVRLFLIALLFTTPAIADDCLYTYRAGVVEAYDGDTITVDIDLGLHVWVRGEKLRLARINAPEVRGVERENGLLSRDALRSWIVGEDIILRTIRDKKGKYGRYLGEVFLDGENINDRMVTEGFATYREY